MGHVQREAIGGLAIDFAMSGWAFSPDGRFVYVLAATLDHAVTVFRRRCGDRVIDGDETCDDGNFVSGDGCDAACRVEP